MLKAVGHTKVTCSKETEGCLPLARNPIDLDNLPSSHIIGLIGSSSMLVLTRKIKSKVRLYSHAKLSPSVSVNE